MVDAPRSCGFDWESAVGTRRLEAFSDAVIAILITVMVLELKIPHGTGIHALRPLVPIGLTYVLSFTFLGIYWNNHHHMLQATERVNGKVLWANLHLLFWLSLIPVTTGWMGGMVSRRCQRRSTASCCSRPGPRASFSNARSSPTRR